MFAAYVLILVSSGCDSLRMLFRTKRDPRWDGRREPRLFPGLSFPYLLFFTNPRYTDILLHPPFPLHMCARLRIRNDLPRRERWCGYRRRRPCRRCVALSRRRGCGEGREGYVGDVSSPDIFLGSPLTASGPASNRNPSPSSRCTRVRRSSSAGISSTSSRECCKK